MLAALGRKKKQRQKKRAGREKGSPPRTSVPYFTRFPSLVFFKFQVPSGNFSKNFLALGAWSRMWAGGMPKTSTILFIWSTCVQDKPNLSFQLYTPSLLLVSSFLDELHISSVQGSVLDTEDTVQPIDRIHFCPHGATHSTEGKTDNQQGRKQICSVPWDFRFNGKHVRQNGKKF